MYSLTFPTARNTQQTQIHAHTGRQLCYHVKYREANPFCLKVEQVHDIANNLPSLMANDRNVTERTLSELHGKLRIEVH